jgi:predicted nucleic acid-binding protein
MTDQPAYTLDAWAVLAYLQAEEPAARRVLDILQAAQRKEVTLTISMINLGEVYYRIGKVHGLEEADQILADLRQIPMQIIPADPEAVLAAARLKMKHAISYADAFAAATALSQKATLLTGDPELKSIRGLFEVEGLTRHRP